MQDNSVNAVILSAGVPHVGSKPSPAQLIGASDTILNWQIRAFEAMQTFLVVGFEKELITNTDQIAQTVNNPLWQVTGSAYSLSLVVQSLQLSENDFRNESELIVCYGDTLFRNQAVEALRASTSDLAIAWDSRVIKAVSSKSGKKPERVYVRDCELQRAGELPSYLSNGTFVGLVRFKGEALKRLAHVFRHQTERFKTATVADLVEVLRGTGVHVDAVDVHGDWAEVGSDFDIVRFVLGTKAETLARMQQIVSKSVIADQVSFEVKQWRKQKAALIAHIQNTFHDALLIVRSSARSEDSFTHSNAGAYTSILNVDANDDHLESAIEEVIASYHNPQPDDQVLVQPMLKNVIRSGVAFTRTLEHGSPYYVINYDETGSTDGITTGNGRDHKTLVVRRGASAHQVANARLFPLLEAMKEIENLLSFDSLDIEFAMTEDELVHILQIRPIAVQKPDDETSCDACNEALLQAETSWAKLEVAAPHLAGDHPLYGVMPDWNPAEIIGTNPGKLAETLYKYLIMDETWATQRAEYGYRDVRPHPLLVSFAGKPYVDVRASFNSFIPKNINDEEAGQFVNFYLSYLKANPKLHDKVEFDVLPTCVGPAFYRWEERLQHEGGFSAELIAKLKSGLLDISRHAVEKTKDYLSNVSKLQDRINLRRQRPRVASIRNVRLLLDECRLYGTLPFAHLARSGFVAVTFLKEGVKEGWLTQLAMDDFMSSVRTVSHELTDDAKATAVGKMSWDHFVAIYGHLRPGTYDITSPAYLDDPEQFLRPIVESAMEAKHAVKTQSAWLEEKANFFAKVKSLGLDFSGDALEQFLRDAIEGREKAKFIFSRNLSEALDMMRVLASEFGLTVEEWANLSVYDVFGLSETTLSASEQQGFLRAEASKNARQRKSAATCELPPLLTGKDDFYSFELSAGMPNFIGSERIMAPCIHLRGTEQGDIDVQGVVVLIPQADPGFDWLFGQGIAGLITMYGGANSHMAIRSAEFGLSAAIGVGEQLFKQLSQAKAIELDPANKLLRPLR